MQYLKAGSKTEIKFHLNGEPVKGMAEPRRLLVDFLRHDLGLTGTHVGCEHGVCGACTIRINGKAARSCLLYAVQMSGKTVETVESLGSDDRLNSLQTNENFENCTRYRPCRFRLQGSDQYLFARKRLPNQGFWNFFRRIRRLP